MNGNAGFSSAQVCRGGEDLVQSVARVIGKNVEKLRCMHRDPWGGASAEPGGLAVEQLSPLPDGKGGSG